MPEINIGEDGFDSHDWLDRKPTANRLSELVNRLPDPMVIALDGEWGSGKSHFLKLWVREHQIWLEATHGGKQSAKIIYFDAFKHDYLDDPLASLVIAMQGKLSPEGQMGDELKKAAWPLIKAAAKTVSPMLAAVDPTLAAAKPALEAGVDALSNMQKSLWDQEEKRVKATEDFKEAIEKIAADRKIIFIIDELDRCRPDYALGILEVIKHFFHVENVHFVLGANFRALEASVESTYGEKINAAGYLKKFVDFFVRFTNEPDGLNKTSAMKHYSKIIGKLNGEGHPLGKRRNIPGAIGTLLDDFPEISKRISLRDINRLVSRMMLLPNNRHMESSDKVWLVAAVAVLEVIDRESFKNLLDGTLEKEKIRSLFYVAQKENAHSRHVESAIIIDLLCHVVDENYASETGKNIYGQQGEGMVRRLHFLLKQNIVEWFTTFHFADEEEEKDAGT